MAFINKEGFASITKSNQLESFFDNLATKYSDTKDDYIVYSTDEDEGPPPEPKPKKTKKSKKSKKKKYNSDNDYATEPDDDQSAVSIDPMKRYLMSKGPNKNP